jgi:hypothetical protein
LPATFAIILGLFVFLAVDRALMPLGCSEAFAAVSALLLSGLLAQRVKGWMEQIIQQHKTGRK